jgi:hypothetical protein
MKIAMCAMLTVGYMNADAAPLRWNLDGGTFLDGGSANGSFVYDADTNTYSDIAINTTAGTILGGATYLDVVVGTVNGFRVVPDAALADLTGSLNLGIVFFTPLTNFGGTIDLQLIFEGFCLDSTCSGITLNGGRLIDIGGDPGSVTAVPLPAAVWLFGSGLLGLVGVARRRQAA